MSLNLDARQRAMLKEMGIRVWLPEPQTASHDPQTATPEIQVAPKNRAVTPYPQKAPSSFSSQTPAPSSQATPSSKPIAVQLLASSIDAMDWDQLQSTVASCQACGLCKSRKNTVFGAGDKQARWLVVGEAPGENEDLQGEPFVGNAGQLLDNMLRAMGLDRHGAGSQGVYITNVLKCRPPANRNPDKDEVLQCEPYLRRQVALLQPQIILALGRFAAQSVLGASVPDIASIPLGKLRGQVHHYQGVPVIVSYHPAYLLRSLGEKAKAWADLCLAMDEMDKQASAVTRG
jgi:uracil-DNA glycosylase family 4